MAIFTVHEPPPRRGHDQSDPTRIAFVRDGFSFWAFLLGPLWMLWHRLWLALLGYIAVAAVLQIGLALVGAPESARALASLFLAVLVGLEASTLRRWTFSRRRWTPLGVVVADDRSMAERRFFDAWLGGAAAPAATSHVAAPPAYTTHAPGDGVLGLFPQPGARA